MTTAEITHPNITASAQELVNRLEGLLGHEGEEALTLRIIVRNGVPRKWKFSVEDEPDLTLHRASLRPETTLS